MEIAQIVAGFNGKVEHKSYAVQEFILLKAYEKPKRIRKQADIYALGAIMFKLLLGRAPEKWISQYIADNKLHEQKSDSNVYIVPSFFNDYILSNDMCRVIVKMLHKDPEHRYESIYQVKTELQRIKDNILATPVILRQILGHPVLPKEDFGQNAIPKQINFKNSKMDEFSLKYLAKYVFEHRVESLAINGGFMPLQAIKTDQLQQLDLKEQGLHSEDLFILSQYLKHNKSITHINLAKNMIGFKYVADSKMIEVKLQNQDKLKDFSF